MKFEALSTTDEGVVLGMKYDDFAANCPYIIYRDRREKTFRIASARAVACCCC